MQLTDKKGLDKRITYYSAKGYASQLEASENYYKLKPVIFIGILNFEYLQSSNYLSRHLIWMQKLMSINSKIWTPKSSNIISLVGIFLIVFEGKF
jgi:predicted transposase/invertase (TIGR01784 family)